MQLSQKSEDLGLFLRAFSATYKKSPEKDPTPFQWLSPTLGNTDHLSLGFSPCQCSWVKDDGGGPSLFLRAFAASSQKHPEITSITNPCKWHSPTQSHI